MYWLRASIQDGQAPGDATVLKRFFRDNFVIFRHLVDIGPWRVPKSGDVTITKIENLHIDTPGKIHWFQKMLFFSIYDEN